METFYSSQQQNSLTATYDPMGELSNLTCSSPATISEYFQYDASGLRIYRNANTAVDSYFYDGETLVARQPGNGAVYYLYGPTGLIQECTENISGAFSNVYTYSFDPNGNTVQRNQTYPGGPQNYSSYIVDTPALYDAYGQQNWANWFQGPPNDVNNGVADLNGLIFRYKGQYGCVTDTESGLLYCSHRYYDPFVARWITRDPTGLGGGINTYQYCDGNPLSTADPSGTQSTDEYLGRGVLREIYRHFGFASTYQADTWFRHLVIKGAEQAPGPLGSWGKMSVGIAHGNIGLMFGAMGSASLDVAGPEIPEAGEIGEAGLEAVEKIVPLITKNAAKGRAAQQFVLEKLLAQGRDARYIGKGIKTPFGFRFPDIGVFKDNVLAYYVEVKAGASRYLKSQRNKDAYIKAVQGIHTDVKRVP